MTVMRFAYLRDHLELAAEDREGLAVNAMRVARGIGVGPRAVDGRVDGEGGRVDRLIAFHHQPVLVHEYEVRHLDKGEVHRERIQPWEVGDGGK